MSNVAKLSLHEPPHSPYNQFPPSKLLAQYLLVFISTLEKSLSVWGVCRKYRHAFECAAITPLLPLAPVVCTRLRKKDSKTPRPVKSYVLFVSKWLKFAITRLRYFSFSYVAVFCRCIRMFYFLRCGGHCERFLWCVLFV